MRGERGEVHKALSAAKAEFLPLKRTGVNPHLRSRYATLADMMEACEPALRKHGLMVMWPLAGDCVPCEIIHVESGQYVDSVLPLTPAKQGDAQALGSWITYCRRYTLNALLGLDADIDDDGHAAKAPEAKEPDEVYRGALQVFTGAQEIPSIEQLCVRTKTDPAKILKAYKVKSLAELSVNEVDEVRRTLERRLAEQAA